MAESYEDFAGVYDELMDATPYQAWCDTLAEWIEKYGISKPVRGNDVRHNGGAQDDEDMRHGNDVQRGSSAQGSEKVQHENSVRHEEDILGQERAALLSERNLVLDLGCGTGTLTELLYQKGYDMIGVDNSSAMLNLAMEKRAKSGSDILYLLQDMRELELYSTVGTVVSVCDSVNYILEEEELEEVFRLVNNYLYPGGLFIFDFNTVYKYREIIGESVIAENRENCSFIWENYYDEDTCRNEYDVTVFVREEDNLFRRFEETHVQRGYQVQQMKELIQRAGMQVVEILDADTLGEVTEHSERVYVIAREYGKKIGGK